MKLENQVVSLELAKKLKELGVKQDSLAYWGWYLPMDEGARNRGGHLWRVGYFEHTPKDCYALADSEEFYSAFSVAELGEILPFEIGEARSWSGYKDGKGNWEAWLEEQGEMIGHTFVADTEADARAKTLVYLLENDLLSLNK